MKLEAAILNIWQLKAALDIYIQRGAKLNSEEDFWQLLLHLILVTVKDCFVIFISQKVKFVQSLHLYPMSENRQLNSNFDFHPPEMIKPRIERDSMMFAK